MGCPLSSTTPDTDRVPVRNDPHAVLALMAEVADSALGQGLAVVHPEEIEPNSEGGVLISLAAERRDRSPTTAPELAVSATSPTSLSYALGAIGMLSALGSVEPAPETAEQHRAWVDTLVDRLETRWAGRWGADQVIDCIARCLAFEPLDRPDPRQLMDEVLRARVRQRSTSQPRTGPNESLRADPSTRSPRPAPFLWIGIASGVVLVLSIGVCGTGVVLNRLAGVGTPTAPASVEQTRPVEASTAQGARGPSVVEAPASPPEAPAPPAPALPPVVAPPEGRDAPAPEPAVPPPAPTATERAPAKRKRAPDPPPPPKPAPVASPSPEPPAGSPEAPERPDAGPASDLRDPWTQ